MGSKGYLAVTAREHLAPGGRQAHYLRRGLIRPVTSLDPLPRVPCGGKGESSRAGRHSKLWRNGCGGQAKTVSAWSLR